MLERSLILFAIFAGGVAHAQDSVLSADQKESTVSYYLVHKMHKIKGVSKKVEGRAKVLGTGQVQVAVRVPVESFDSENVNRDSHMKEAVEAARFPNVELKAVGEGVQPPTTFPTTIEKTFKAQVTFHGVQQTMDVPVKLTVENDKRVRATATFNISLEAFKVERPSLMFIKVEDALKIEANVVFTK